MDLTEGSVLKSLLIFAVPMVLASLLQQLYSAVDLMVIGRYVGSVGTVAVSTGGEPSDLITLIAVSFSMGAQVYISQLAGAKDIKNLKEAIGTNFTILFGMSLVVMIGIFFFRNSILGLLNCPEEAWKEASDYMLITAIGMPFIFGYNGIAAVLRGMGESARPMVFIAVAAVVNIFADLLFVIVFRLDAAGTAIATVLSQIGSFVAAFYYMYKNKETFGFELRLSYFKVRKNALRRILRMAIPQLIRSISVQGSMLWVKSNINAYGLVTSSTYSIGNKVEKFMNVFVQGVDGAAGAMVGQNIGAKKPKRVSQILAWALVVSMGFSIVVMAMFLLIPSQLYSLFTTDAEVIEFGHTFLRILAIGMPVICIASCFKSISTGSGAALLSLFIGVSDGVSRILVCLIAYHLFNQGSQSYFWGAAFCMVVPGLASMAYFFSGKWKTKKLLSET